jgi:hypothetical protein
MKAIEALSLDALQLELIGVLYAKAMAGDVGAAKVLLGKVKRARKAGRA